MAIDKTDYHEDPSHILLIWTWACARGLVHGVAAHSPDAWTDPGDGIFEDELTEAGREFAIDHYPAFLDWFGTHGQPIAPEDFEPTVYAGSTRWLDRMLREHRQASSTRPTISHVRERLSVLATSVGLTPHGDHGWARPARHGTVGFALEGQRDPQLGLSFQVRLVGGTRTYSGTSTRAHPEHRLVCWVGEDGRRAMSAINARALDRLPPISEWRTVDDIVAPPRRVYRPADDPWLRAVAPADVDAWMAFLAERLPAVLQDMDEHYAMKSGSVADA